MNEAEKKRVMFLVYSLSGGGTERMVSRLANAFSQNNFEVYIGLFDMDNIQYTINTSVMLVNFESKANNKIMRFASRIKLIKKFVIKRKINVVYAFMISLVPYAILGKGGMVKVIGAERTNPKVLSKYCKLIIRFFSPKCDGFIFQTNGAKLFYPKQTQKRSAIIGNISPQVNSTVEFKISQSICTSGRLHTDKDFYTLFRALKKVLNEIPSAVLYIYGEGPQKEELILFSKKLEIGNNIVWKEFSTNILEEMKMYDVFIFASKAEGMPNSLIEAMTVGLPCVATDCEFGPSELISTGENGFLVPVGDDQLMAKFVIELLRDKNLRMRVGENAKESMTHYSESKIVSRYMDYTYKVIAD